MHHSKHSDLIHDADPPVQWLIEPYVPAHGVTFLYGKTSIGKSPLTWKMAQCVSEGLDFFHCPTTQGPVLYLEVDTPISLVKPRIRLLTPVPQALWWLPLYPGIDILTPSPDTHHALLSAMFEVKPVLVIINTLRKIHFCEDIKSNIANIIYSRFRAYFPDAALLFVHHDKKTSGPDHHGDEDEAFSGTNAFWSDATVGLHLVRTNRKENRVRLVHTKSQVGPLAASLHLQLHEDGTNWVETGSNAILASFRLLDPLLGMERRVQLLRQEFGVSRSTIYRAVSGAKE